MGATKTIWQLLRKIPIKIDEPSMCIAINDKRLIVGCENEFWISFAKKSYRNAFMNATRYNYMV